MDNRDFYPASHVRRIHLIGIGGAGMNGIAEVLHNLGYCVSGSDLCESRVTRNLRALGIDVRLGHERAHVRDSDVVVRSKAIDADNPELAAAREWHIPIVPRAEMLAELMRFRQGIAVAGTHGKTTTTSLVASLLADGGLDPIWIVGGLLNRTGSGASLGAGRYMVAEADESDGSFRYLQPVITVLTNVDNDHLDLYGGDPACLHNAFVEFLGRLPFYGLAVLCRDDPGCAALLPKLSRSCLTYGFSQGADYRASGFVQEGNRSRFRLHASSLPEPLELELAMPGRHNVRNSLAAVAVAHRLGVDVAVIAKGLCSFQGIARRCQLRAQLNVDGRRVQLIDDYAHHPREIEATLDALRNGWPGRRIVVIFQPHRYTRTRDQFEEFVRVLSRLELVVMMDVYAAGEPPIPGADTPSLVHALRVQGRTEPIYAGRRDEAAELLRKLVRDGDILLVLGAGDINLLPPELEKRFPLHARLVR